MNEIDFSELEQFIRDCPSDQRVHISLSYEDKYSLASMNGHGVGLERTQRIHQGIDSEPMEFSEETLAAMVQDLADDLGTGHKAFVLRAIANALSGRDDHHKLVLRQKKPGKWVSPTEYEESLNREMSWLWTLGAWEKQGMKTEAAVAKISELSGSSRAAVFAGVKKAEKFIHRAFWGLKPKGFQGPPPAHLCNPRPAKNSDN